MKKFRFNNKVVYPYVESEEVVEIKKMLIGIKFFPVGAAILALKYHNEINYDMDGKIFDKYICRRNNHVEQDCENEEEIEKAWKIFWELVDYFSED